MRKVVRPDSTTYFIEFAYHFCKDDQEVANAILFEKEESILRQKGFVDPDTFVPYEMFIILNSNTLATCPKYICEFGALDRVIEHTRVKSD